MCDEFDISSKMIVFKTHLHFSSISFENGRSGNSSRKVLGSNQVKRLAHLGIDCASQASLIVIFKL